MRVIGLIGAGLLPYGRVFHNVQAEYNTLDAGRRSLCAAFRDDAFAQQPGRIRGQIEKADGSGMSRENSATAPCSM